MSLASSIASPRQGRIASIAQGIVVFGAIAAMLVRDDHTHIPSLVPALVIAQLMTAYLLISQSIQQRCPATALLGGAYVITTVSYNIAPRLLFPSGVEPEMYALFGITAHVGFAACFVAYAFLEHECNLHLFETQAYRVRLAAIVAIVLFLPLLGVALFSMLQSASIVSYGALRWLAAATTVVAYIVYSLRATKTVTNLWMRVALLADLADALLVAIAPQGSFHVFAAQVFGLISCGAMPTVYMIEFNAMYARLASTTQDFARQAMSDHLTDVANRRRFDDHIQRLCDAQSRGKLHRFSILMLDIDDFKRFNDSYGHRKGDECLRRVAKAVQRALYRPGDEIARFGGEEFVVILQAAGPADAAIVAERIRLAVWNLMIPNSSSPLGRVSVSIGIASAPDHGDAPDTLVDRADAALYRAKSDGKNRAVAAGELTRGSQADAMGPA